MLLIAWSALPAGLVSNWVTREVGTQFIWAGRAAGVAVGVLVGFLFMPLFWHLGGIPILCLAGSIMGPAAGQHLFPLTNYGRR